MVACVSTLVTMVQTFIGNKGGTKDYALSFILGGDYLTFRLNANIKLLDNERGFLSTNAFISRNWPKCKHFICDYMWLLVICNYIWTFLQLFLVLVIFATTLQLVCDYFGVHLSMWTTFSLVFIQEKQFMSH
jgi:hypothetical protein